MQIDADSKTLDDSQVPMEEVGCSSFFRSLPIKIISFVTWIYIQSSVLVPIIITLSSSTSLSWQITFLKEFFFFSNLRLFSYWITTKFMHWFWSLRFDKYFFFSLPAICQIKEIGSVALLWWNAKHNVNPGLSFFELCWLACACLVANLNLHFAFSN